MFYTWRWFTPLNYNSVQCPVWLSFFNLFVIFIYISTNYKDGKVLGFLNFVFKYLCALIYTCELLNRYVLNSGWVFCFLYDQDALGLQEAKHPGKHWIYECYSKCDPQIGISSQTSFLICKELSNKVSNLETLIALWIYHDIQMSEPLL